MSTPEAATGSASTHAAATRVTVHGAGLAGLTCAALLARAGCRTTLTGGPSAGGPRHLVLNEPTVTVLTHVWGDDVLAGSHALTTRRIRWGPGAAEQDLPAPAIVVDAPRLLAILDRRLTGVDRLADPAPSDWEVHTMAVHGAGGTEATGGEEGAGGVAVGRRCAMVGYAPLAPGVPATACRMATTVDSWLYLTPLGDGRAMIQAMTPTPPPDPDGFLAAELDASGLGSLFAGPPERVTVVPAAPWLAEHRAQRGRLRIGGGVIRLDPVSGSGAGHALRTAVLAAAVITGIRDGLPADTALDHYARRLGAAFLDHLTACASHYRAAFDTAAWAEEVRVTEAAITTYAGSPHGFGLTLHASSTVDLRG
ncbi:hypothetical protein [Actinoplanes sp. NPDC023714]|uniref:hypothetical protein n=1 Tax=Actinoplanes sp. NPDC023714 TaxID=3154322 RepID=UPI0033DF3C8B